MITNINLNKLLAIPLDILCTNRRDIKEYFVYKVSRDYQNSPVISSVGSYNLLMFPTHGNYKGTRIRSERVENVIELIQKYTPFSEKSLENLYEEARNKEYVKDKLQELNVDGWWDDILRAPSNKGKPIVYVKMQQKVQNYIYRGNASVPFSRRKC